MLGGMGRRVVEGGVLLFAVLGFTQVRLGEKTGYEHAREIAKSAPVTKAAEEMLGAVKELMGDGLPKPAASSPPSSSSDPSTPAPGAPPELQ